MIDTLGLVYLDPAGQHRGPVERDAGLLEITSRLPSPRGDLTRVSAGRREIWVGGQQHLYDVNGQLLLSTRASRQRFYRDEAVTMPHRVEVTRCRASRRRSRSIVDVASYSINRLTGDSTELWAMPQIEGYPSVDIADPQFRLPVAAIPPGADGTATAYGARRPTGYGPDVTAPMNLRARRHRWRTIRGYESRRM